MQITTRFLRFRASNVQTQALILKEKQNIYEANITSAKLV